MSRQNQPLQGKTVLLGVTGGIAAYKSCELASRLVKMGAEVNVVMTKNACEFVGPVTFQTLTRRPVVLDTFAVPEKWEVEHVALAKKADLVVVAPATADILAKMAHGIADDMLSTTLLAVRAPVLAAPAMNTAMWEHPATRSNMAALRARGVMVIGPEGGVLACGDVGGGRMTEPGDIAKEIERILCHGRDMAGLKVLVTAGPTREKIDPVRFLSNRSTGRMGYAIAEAAIARGAEVTLLSGPTALQKPECETVFAESTEELFNAMLDRCGDMDIIIQAAAPADFTPDKAAAQKIKKGEGGELLLRLVSTPDIARAVGERKKPGQVLVGFAAETENTLENARGKLQKKNLDMIVLNDVTRPGAGFGTDTNIVTLITLSGDRDLPLMKKRAVADEILSGALQIYKEKHGA